VRGGNLQFKYAPAAKISDINKTKDIKMIVISCMDSRSAKSRATR